MTLRPARNRLIALALAIGMAVLVAVRLTTPVAVRAADAPATQFSGGRAMRDIAIIGRLPHPVGTAEHKRVREYLVGRLRGLGLEVATPAWPMSPKAAARLASWSHRDVTGVPVIDVVGRWRGADPRAPALLLMAHYDTVWGSPGAADDTAGMVTILEDLRALKARGVAPARDIIVLFSDGEEVGLDGARHFFEHDPVAGHVGVVVNHETRGGGGRTAMFETGHGNSALMRLFARGVPHPLTDSISIMIYDAMPNSTDYTVAKKRGIAGFNFAFAGRASLYHSPLATPERIEPAAVEDMGEQSLGLVGILATVPALPGPSGDATFSDALGIGTIVYPPAAGWGIVAVSAVLLAIAAILLVWAQRIGWRGVGAGAIAAAWTVTLAAALLALANAVSTGRPHPDYFDRLAALHRLEAQAALACLAAILIGERRRWWLAPALIGIGVGIAAQSEHPLFGLIAVPGALLALLLPAEAPKAWPGWIGAQALVLIAGAAAQALAPTATPLLLWTALLAALATVTAALADPGLVRWRALAPIVMLAAIGGAKLLAFAHFTFGAIGAGLPMVMAVFLLLLLALFRPLIGAWRGPGVRIILALVLVATFAIALDVRLDPIAPSIPVYPDR